MAILRPYQTNLNTLSIQFHLYSAKSQLQSRQGTLYCKVNPTIIYTEKKPNNEMSPYGSVSVSMS